MNPSDISAFAESLKRIESFFSELAARDTELGYAGLGSARLWKSYSATSDSFAGFDRKLYEVIKVSKFVDSDLHSRILTVATDSKIAEGITQVAVSVKISEMRRERDVALRKVYASTMGAVAEIANRFLKVSALNSRRGLSFREFDVSLSNILVALNRLISLCEELAEVHERKLGNDNESFKPSNINIESINIYIEGGIKLLRDSESVGPETKDRLIEYLDEIRIELSNDSPKWRNIVGGLVIVSTILSGIAAAPQAREVIQEAIEAILGTSIEKQYPHSIPSDKGDAPKLIMV